MQAIKVIDLQILSNVLSLHAFCFTFQIIFTESCYNATNQKEYSSSTNLIYVQDEGPSGGVNTGTSFLDFALQSTKRRRFCIGVQNRFAS